MSDVANKPEVWVRKVLFFWVAINPNETLATVDCSTYYFGLSRESAVNRCRRAFSPKPPKWEDA